VVAEAGIPGAGQTIHRLKRRGQVLHAEVPNQVAAMDDEIRIMLGHGLDSGLADLRG